MEIILILLGAIIALISSLYLENIKYLRQKIDRKEHGKNLLSVIIQEIKYGIDRCEGMSALRQKTPHKYSPSLIYTNVWNSTITEVTRAVDDTDIYNILLSIYHKFDLINFNMNKEDYIMGLNFVISKLPEIKTDLHKLESLYTNYIKDEELCEISFITMNKISNIKKYIFSGKVIRSVLRKIFNDNR